ncbi:hypothetical protein D9M71_432370 [compost metagenome]
MAGLLDLQLGDQLEHVDHPAQAQVTAIGGDDEVFFDALPRAAGQQAADLLQGLVHLDGEKVLAHQAGDGFAGEQVGAERLEQHFRQGMTMHDAARVLLVIEHGQGIEVGLAAEGLQHSGRGRVPGDGRLRDEQGAKVAGILAERRQAGIDLTGQHGRALARWLLLGATQQIALDQVHAHFTEHRELFSQLDAFGDHLRTRSLGDLQDGADELALDRILMDAVDKMPVDLHIVRAQL